LIEEIRPPKTSQQWPVILLYDHERMDGWTCLGNHKGVARTRWTLLHNDYHCCQSIESCTHVCALVWRCRKKLELSRRSELKGYKLDDEARVVVNNLQTNTGLGQLSTAAKKRERQQQQRSPLQHLNILPGSTDPSLSVLRFLPLLSVLKPL